MPFRASLLLRWSRAAVIGAVSLCIGTVAHTAADGLVPGPSGIVVLTVGCTALAAMFLGREASSLRLATLVVAGQAVMHTGLAALAGHRGDPSVAAAHEPLTPPRTAPVPRVGTYFDQWEQSRPVADGSGPVVPAWLVHAFEDITANPAMALSHVLAAVVVGLWLRLGESALWNLVVLTAGLALHLVRQLWQALVTRPTLLPNPGTSARCAAYRSVHRPRRPSRAAPLSRRGPPVLLTAA